MKKLNLKELRKNKNSRVVSIEKALTDIVNFNWTEEVLAGEVKVEVR